MNWSRRHRTLALGLLCLLVTLLVGAGYWTESALVSRGVSPVFLLKMENYAHDFLQKSGRKAPMDSSLVYLGVGDSSITLNGLSDEEIAASSTLRSMRAEWPWDRSVYHAILDRLIDAGAKVVIFDLLFPSPRSGDAQFRDALERHREQVALGSNIVQGTPGATSSTTTLSLPTTSLIPSTELPDRRVGYVNHFADADGVLRRMRYQATMEDFGTPAAGEAPQVFDSLVACALRLTGRPDLIPDRNPVAIRFAGPSGTFRPHPVFEIFLPSLWKANYRDGTFFKDKIVIVGPEGNFHQDIHPTAVDEAMPGPEIHLNAFNAALNRDFLRETSLDFDLVIICLTGLAAWLTGGLIRQPGVRLSVLAAFGGVYLLALWILFNQRGWLTVSVTPLFVLGSSGTGCFFYDLILERFERQRLRRVLNVHLSRSVAEVILADRDSFEAALAGKAKRATILFSDIRGFSTWSETVTPTQLVAQLNEYFLGMVDPILAEDGTLLRFIGDAIFAAWGDTHSRGHAEDARRAVRAALAMRAAMARLNEGWRMRSDRRELSTGIGINHGDVTVGQVGHPVRYEFSVMGDATNLAARLETATKQFHADILVSSAVVELTGDTIRYRSVDRVIVKGKTNAIDIFTPLSLLTAPEPEWWERYERAVTLFRTQRFGEAEQIFREADAILGGSDFLCQLYLGRCGQFAKDPPPAAWDGSHALSEK